MATPRQRASITGWLGFAAATAAIGFWIGHTGPTTEPPNYQSPPAQTQDAWTPEPLRTEPIASPYGPEQDCGDGTRGTFAECWARNRETAQRHAREAEASRSAAAQQAWPTTWPTLSAVPSYQPPAVTLCSDGSISSSTGRGTCSWHGGVAP